MRKILFSLFVLIIIASWQTNAAAQTQEQQSLKYAECKQALVGIKLNREDESLVSGPVFSPKGDKIAFLAITMTAQLAKLYVVNSDGTNKKLLYSFSFPSRYSTTPELSLSFSPDGKRILFLEPLEKWINNGRNLDYTWGAFNNILVFDTENGSKSIVGISISYGESFHSPAPQFSPDGKKLAFVPVTLGDLPKEIGENIKNNNDYGIWILDLETSKKYNLLKTDMFDENSEIGSLKWKPSSTMIGYSTYKYRNEKLYTLNSETMERRLITKGELIDWSPEGDKILFRRPTPQGLLHEIWIINDDGSNEKQISSLPSTIPSWSPDGKYISFYQSEEENWGEWVDWNVAIADETGKIDIVDKFIVQWGSPGDNLWWFSDGKKLVYYSGHLRCIYSSPDSDTPLSRPASRIAIFDIEKRKKILERIDAYPIVTSPKELKMIYSFNNSYYLSDLNEFFKGQSENPGATATPIPESNKIAEAASQYSRLFDSEFWGNEAKSRADAFLNSYTDPLSVTLKAAKDILTSVFGAAKMNSAAGILDDLSKSYSAVSAAGNQGLLAGMDVKANGIGGNTLSEEFTSLANLLNENKDPKQQLVVVSNKIELYREMLKNPDKYDVSGAKEWSESVKMFTMNKNILLSMLDSAQEFTDALKINYGMEVPETNPPSQSSKRIPGFEAFSSLILIIIVTIEIKGNKGNNYG